MNLFSPFILRLKFRSIFEMTQKDTILFHNVIFILPAKGFEKREIRPKTENTLTHDSKPQPLPAFL